MRKLLIGIIAMLGMIAPAYSQNQVTVGTIGPRGYTGARGPAGNVSINSVTTGAPGTPVSVVNVGTPSNALLNITIPRGSTIFSGNGSPQNTTGLVGDFYLDLQAACLYGPKASTVWSSMCINLVGAPGSQSPGYVLIGPVSGTATTPTFRHLVTADLPTDVVMSTVTMRVTSPTSLVPGDTKTYLQVDYSGTIVGWSIVADQPGSINVDVWKVASSPPPAAPAIPTSAAIISGSNPITLNNAQSASVDAAGVNSWSTTAVAAYDVFGFSISSASVVSAVTVQLFIKRN